MKEKYQILPKHSGRCTYGSTYGDKGFLKNLTSKSSKTFVTYLVTYNLSGIFIDLELTLPV